MNEPLTSDVVEQPVTGADRKAAAAPRPTNSEEALTMRRTSEAIARETLDAIRLAIEAAANDRAAVMVIRTLLADSTPARSDDTGSVKRLLRAVKRTRRARWTLT